MNSGTPGKPIKLTKGDTGGGKMDYAAHLVSLCGINACARFTSKVNGIEYSEVTAHMDRQKPLTVTQWADKWGLL